MRVTLELPWQPPGLVYCSVLCREPQSAAVSRRMAQAQRHLHGTGHFFSLGLAPRQRCSSSSSTSSISIDSWAHTRVDVHGHNTEFSLSLRPPVNIVWPTILIYCQSRTKEKKKEKIKKGKKELPPTQLVYGVHRRPHILVPAPRALVLLFLAFPRFAEKTSCRRLEKSSPVTHTLLLLSSLTTPSGQPKQRSAREQTQSCCCSRARVAPPHHILQLNLTRKQNPAALR